MESLLHVVENTAGVVVLQMKLIIDIRYWETIMTGFPANLSSWMGWVSKKKINKKDWRNKKSLYNHRAQPRWKPWSSLKDRTKIICVITCGVVLQSQRNKRHYNTLGLSNDEKTNHPRMEADLNWRVWSWLRLNAGGMLNTCKSNGSYFGSESGGRVSNA